MITYPHCTFEIRNQSFVTKTSGTTRIFQQSTHELYYLNTQTPSTTQNESIFIITVAGKLSNYTNKDYSQAQPAHSIQQIIGRPNTQQLLH